MSLSMNVRLQKADEIQCRCTAKIPQQGLVANNQLVLPTVANISFRFSESELFMR